MAKRLRSRARMGLATAAAGALTAGMLGLAAPAARAADTLATGGSGAGGTSGVVDASGAGGTSSAAGARGAAGSCPTGQWPKRELRGEWIASVGNIDWPSKPGLTPAQQKAEYENLLDQADRMNLNAAFVQIRPTADAFYPSPYEPWSKWLTGTQGKDPGYDPLAFLVQATHAHNLEFHAWMNPYRISTNDDWSQLAASSPAKRHPDWVVDYGHQLYFNPGIPAVRSYLEKVVLDVVEKYDIDGVHFDDYFYPYPTGGKDFPDGATYAKYGQGYASKADWRRANVDKLMAELDRKIHAVKPWVKFGVSPFGVWRNQADDPTGSATTAGATDYDSLYADTRTWIRNGWVDYIAPEIYWSHHLSAAAYDVLVPWWEHEVKGTDVALYIGEAAYKINANADPAWENSDELPSHITMDRQEPLVDGNIYFSASQLTDNPLGFTDRLANDLYAHPALVPVTDHLGAHAPHPVTLARATSTQDGVQLRWPAAPAHSNATSYVVYRVDGRSGATACDFTTGDHIVASLHRTPGLWQSWTDPTARPGHTYTYYVTALDRLHHESRPSPGRWVTVR